MCVCVCLCVCMIYNLNLIVNTLFFVYVLMLRCKDHFHYNWSLVWYIIVTTAGDNNRTTHLTEVPCEDEAVSEFCVGRAQCRKLVYFVKICGSYL